jgi:hypothetical protein
MLTTTKQRFNIELTFDDWLLETWNLKYGYCTIQHTNAQGSTSFHNAHSKLQVANIMFQLQWLSSNIYLQQYQDSTKTLNNWKISINVQTSQCKYSLFTIMNFQFENLQCNWCNFTCHNTMVMYTTNILWLGESLGIMKIIPTNTISW